jgi:hypothetical protein
MSWKVTSPQIASANGWGSFVDRLSPVVAQSLRPKRIDDHSVWLKGVGEDFRAQFPVAQKP